MTGYLLYIDDTGKLTVAQVTPDGVYDLEPLPEDRNKQLGFYDLQWKLIKPFTNKRRTAGNGA